MFAKRNANCDETGVLAMTARFVPAALLLVSLMTSPTWAIGPCVRVEQDWEVTIDTPDPTGPSPQISFHMDPFPGSPVGCLLLFNYQDTPSFTAGGLTCQIWNLDTPLANQALGNGAILSKAKEKITFTLFMELSSGNLLFGISKGKLPTWGAIPPAGWTISVPYSAIQFFDNYYQTADTMAQSGILFGATSVTAVKLVAVRRYDKAGKNIAEPGQVLYP